MQISGAYSSRSTTDEAEKVSILAYFLIFLITIYQYTLSGMFGGSCRFDPSCSRYTQQALKKHGAWRGSIMGAKRVLRCHPWHSGGYDPVE
jgi:putative membrane protein insertion efficiency factor